MSDLNQPILPDGLGSKVLYIGGIQKTYAEFKEILINAGYEKTLDRDMQIYEHGRIPVNTTNKQRGLWNLYFLHNTYFPALLKNIDIGGKTVSVKEIIFHLNAAKLQPDATLEDIGVSSYVHSSIIDRIIYELFDLTFSLPSDLSIETVKKLRSNNITINEANLILADIDKFLNLLKNVLNNADFPKRVERVSQLINTVNSLRNEIEQKLKPIEIKPSIKGPESIEVHLGEDKLSLEGLTVEGIASALGISKEKPIVALAKEVLGYIDSLKNYKDINQILAFWKNLQPSARWFSKVIINQGKGFMFIHKDNKDKAIRVQLSVEDGKVIHKITVVDAKIYQFEA